MVIGAITPSQVAGGTPRPDLFRVAPDDPEYVRVAAAEAAFWSRPQPFGMDAWWDREPTGPVERYTNERFTGDPAVRWNETIPRYGTFRRGLVLGASALTLEASLLEQNPDAQLTFVDLTEATLERRRQELGTRFPARVATWVADLNFIALPPDTFDLVVSCASIHHVTNLEHLAYQIDRTLTPDGYFFLQDYVAEPRFQFSPARRRLFEILNDREMARQHGRGPGLLWMDASDTSPLCGVRAPDILGVFAAQLTVVDVRTAGALTLPLVRVRPADGLNPQTIPRWKQLLRAIGRLRATRATDFQPRRFLHELFVVGDVASDAGVINPGNAFGIYRKGGRPS